MRAELNNVDTILQAMKDAGEVPASARAEAVKGDALDLPYADGTFDCVIASEILEHVPADDRAIAELVRVLKPGGRLAVTVPRWLPERVCWLLSEEYHANEGGHIRIYRAGELRDKITARGMRFTHCHHAHALHSPFWWLKCACGHVEFRASRGDRVPQAAGVGHDAPTAGHAGRRIGAESGDRQERCAVLPEAGGSPLPSREAPGVPGVLTPGRAGRQRNRSRRHRNPRAPSPGPTAVTPIRGTTSECAMALTVAGLLDPARAAFEWCRTTQRADGSWPIQLRNGVVEDANSDSNFCAYMATGVWHHVLITGDRRFAEPMWPVVSQSDRLRPGPAGRRWRNLLGQR